MVGTTISHYKVLEKIGQGGMGEVYRATDTKLNRDVALKILPQQFASDSQRMARFQREAEVLASLNHPNIAAIHSFEHSDDIHFLVLELVEGETLAERVAKGPVPVEEALEVCRQIRSRNVWDRLGTKTSAVTLGGSGHLVAPRPALNAL